jgi:hypothetical protein
MSEPIPGTVEEWTEIEPTRWARIDHPESGVITLTPPLTFAEYYDRRLAASKLPDNPPQLSLQDLMARIEALEKRLPDGF